MKQQRQTINPLLSKALTNNAESNLYRDILDLTVEKNLSISRRQKIFL